MSVERLVMSLLREFGGVTGVVTEWIAAHKSATGLRRIRSVDAMFRIMRWLEASEPKPSTLDDESLDEQLERELEANVEYAIRANPGMVALVCGRNGFSLIEKTNG